MLSYFKDKKPYSFYVQGIFKDELFLCNLEKTKKELNFVGYT